MNYEYHNCGAMMWLDERINRSVRSPVFMICCAKGKVILPPLQDLPSPLDTLLSETDSRSRSFCQNIRMYNFALSFTSIGQKSTISLLIPVGFIPFVFMKKCITE